MIEDCRQALASALEDADQRTAVQINLAHALSTQSALTGQDDGLPEAVRLVEDVLDQPSANVALLAYATSNLVDAMSQKAERTGDRTGYRQAARPSGPQSRLPTARGQSRRRSSYSATPLRAPAAPSRSLAATCGGEALCCAAGPAHDGPARGDLGANALRQGVR